MIAQQRTLYFLIAFLVAANIFDIINTCYLLQNSSFFEANPITRYLMEQHGCHKGPLLIKTPILLILIWCARYRPTAWITRAIIIPTVLYGMLTGYQILLLFFVYDFA